MSSTVLILGATGETGQHVLLGALQSTAYSSVVEVGRRQLILPPTTPNLAKHTFIQLDFDKLVAGDQTEQSKIKSVKPTAVLCALGTTKAQAGSFDQFVKVDKDYVVAACQAAHHSTIPQTLVYVSSGASNSKSFMPYLKSKGLTEEALANIGYDQTIIFRPGMLVVPGGRKEHRLAEKLAGYATGLVALFSSSIQITTPNLGQAVVNASTLGYKGLDVRYTGQKETLATKEIWAIGNGQAMLLSQIKQQ